MKKIVRITAALCMLLALLTMSVSAAPAEDCPGGESCTHAAAVGTTHYDTLQEAVSAGGSVVLLRDTAEDITVAERTEVVLDLNGHDLTGAGGDVISNHGTLQVTGEGNVSTDASGKGTLVNYPGASAVLDGGTFTATGWYTLKNLGEMEIREGASIVTSTGGSSLIDNGWYGNAGNDRNTVYEGVPASLTIHGGHFEGGMNTVKNDDNGVLTIYDGSFTNTSGPAVLNWNEASIHGGYFEAPNSAVLANGYLGEADKGQLTIDGGRFVSGNGGTELVFTYGVGTGEGGSVTISGGSFTGQMDDSGTNVSMSQYFDMTVNAGAFSTRVPDSYVGDGMVSLSCGSESGTAFYVGGPEEAAAVAAESSADGVVITVYTGDVDLSGLKDGVQVKNEGTGAVTANGSTVETGGSVIVEVHTHDAVEVPAKEATCTEAGNIAYWYCEGCDTYFADKELTREISPEEIISPAKGHQAVKVPAKEATASEAGNKEYWYCEACGTYFADEGLTQVISKEAVVIPAKGGSEPTTSGSEQDGKTETTKSPNTGDGSSYTGWIVLLCAAAAGMAAVIAYGKKRQA